MASIVESRYATSLFEIVKENDEIDETTEQVLFVLQTIKTNPDFYKVVMHPDVSGQDKVKLFDNVFKGVVSQTLKDFFGVIITAHREDCLINTVKYFLTLANKEKNITTANVVSPLKLDDAKIDELAVILSSKFDKEIIVKASVDESLIGGLFIKIDGFVIDTTVKKQMKEMKKMLIESNVLVTQKGV